MYLRGSAVTAARVRVAAAFFVALATLTEVKATTSGAGGSVAEVDDVGATDAGERELGHAVLAVADAQPDGGAALAVDLDVGEGRHAHQVDARRSDVAAGDRQRLDRL